MTDNADFEAVCLAFESLEDLMGEVEQPPAFREDRIRRILERDVDGALDVLHRLRTDRLGARRPERES